jgi:hypothetical protein
MPPSSNSAKVICSSFALLEWLVRAKQKLTTAQHKQVSIGGPVNAPCPQGTQSLSVLRGIGSGSCGCFIEPGRIDVCVQLPWEGGASLCSTWPFFQALPNHAESSYNE